MLMRMISTDRRARIYHKSGCPYCNKISPHKRLVVNVDDRKYQKYRSCRYCGGIQGYVKIFGKRPERRDKERKIKRCWYDKSSNYIFLKTNVGFWKVYFRIRDQKWLLFHLNYFDKTQSDRVLQDRKYHRQRDFAPCNEFDSIVDYIVSHDKSKEIAEQDYRKLPQKTKKQKYIYRHYKKKMRKKYYKHMDQLFESIKTRK